MARLPRLDADRPIPSDGGITVLCKGRGRGEVWTWFDSDRSVMATVLELFTYLTSI